MSTEMYWDPKDSRIIFRAETTSIEMTNVKR